MLVTFEGIDGSGKSTQARHLVQRLKKEGYPALLVREPGGTQLSERVRALLLDPALEVAPFTELLLFSAARAQLVKEAIRPALEEGKVVVCDRFYDSTEAYQGGGRQLEETDWLRNFNRKVTGGLVPERTYLVELPPEQALARTKSEHDRMEKAGLDFYRRVDQAYTSLAGQEPNRFFRLDGRRSIEALHEQVWSDLCTLMKEHGGTPLS